MKKEIIYTDHLQFRLKIREIDDGLPKRIYENSEEMYYDTKTGYDIAVGKAFYKNKLREMAVTYEETNDEIKIVTIHPLRMYEKFSKVKSGRWHIK